MRSLKATSMIVFKRYHFKSELISRVILFSSAKLYSHKSVWNTKINRWRKSIIYQGYNFLSPPSTQHKRTIIDIKEEKKNRRRKKLINRTRIIVKSTKDIRAIHRKYITINILIIFSISSNWQRCRLLNCVCMRQQSNSFCHFTFSVIHKQIK